MTMTKKSLLTMCVTLVLFLNTTFVHADDIWTSMQAASSAESENNYEAAASHWLKLVELYEDNPAKMDWTNYAMYLEKIGDYYSGTYKTKDLQRPLAVDYYDQSFTAYGKAGLVWGEVQTANKANTLRTVLKVFTEEIPKKDQVPNNNYAPAYGAYLGMYAEQDTRLTSGGYVDSTLMSTVFDKNIPMLLVYSTYGVSPFPTELAHRLTAGKSSLQVAMEPMKGLAVVSDDVYIRQWAKDAKASGLPIFLRFGGEMNGAWVPWGESPEAYISKFRLVHDIMAVEAPNVLMLWSPNDIPYFNMMDYYPGDTYVDWVGVSSYAVPDGNGHTDLSNYKRNPLNKLQHIYDEFAGRKPIMLSESAVAYSAKAFPKEDFSAWYANNMARYYHYIPRIYPEIKALVYFNRQEDNNDYQLSSNPMANSVYKEVIKSDYYLNSMEAVSPVTYEELSNKLYSKQPMTFSTYASIYEPFIGSVEYWLDGKLADTSATLPYDYSHDFTDYSKSSAELVVKVFDSANLLAASKTYTLHFQGGSSEIVLQINSPYMAFNGRISEIDPGNKTAPVIINNRTMIPIRTVVENMGGSVGWLGNEQKITVTYEGRVIELWINQPKVLVDGISKSLDSPPVIINSRTLLPLRFITENLGAAVHWNGDQEEVTITY